MEEYNRNETPPLYSSGSGQHQKRRKRGTSESSSQKEEKTSGEEIDYSIPSFNLIIPDGTFFPPLEKVLLNQSGSPLSQYNFYAYLKNEWHGEQNLNFWLDVVTHENLFGSWREYQNYVKNMRERVSYETERQSESDRSNGRGAGRKYIEEIADWEPSHDHHDSNSSAEDTVAPSIANSLVDSTNPIIQSSSSNYRHSYSNRHTKTSSIIFGGGIGNNDHHEISVSSEERSSSDYTQPEIIKRIGEEDLAKSSLSIYKKYGHMNILPEENRTTMQDLIERQGRFNPVVFSSAKSYVYHIMNVIYFPKFIQSAIDMNITHINAIASLPLGILALTIGFALELFLIFIGEENRLKRFWGFPPIWLGWIFLQTAATRFFPPLILFGASEYKLFRFHKIKELAILSAHRKRALTFLMWDTLATIITIELLFVIHPGLNVLSNLSHGFEAMALEALAWNMPKMSFTH
ncbi:5117_t:CDS:2 [Funneliformis geosporum]|uniref:7357_t:CDS:1 n=1 Tax=Funneliformis geosporum TaxID=1117311 RepID=A0A9W4SHY1_9GLOM|nr:7357_t:CDS:2 [Funneliformis geosporum]CAI2170248.1 5117_t:CDS:2 [Funneliformis geosporum]